MDTLMLKLNFSKCKKYNYIILNCSNSVLDIYEAIKELFLDSNIIVFNNDIIIFYSEEDVVFDEFYDIVQSLSFDLGVKIKFFKGGVINKGNCEEFNVLYNVYLLYTNKQYSFSKMSDLVTYMLINNIEELKKIKNILIEKILVDDQLVKLVLSLASNNLNVTKTATSMYMHRNTINNKLDYIKKETGFDIQDFQDAMAVYCLIKYV